jgi:dUTP pyrophosphatase
MKEVTVKVESTTGETPVYKTEGACGFDLKLDKIPDTNENYISGKYLLKYYNLIKDTDNELNEIKNNDLSVSEKEEMKLNLQTKFIDAAMDILASINLSKDKFILLIDYLNNNNLTIVEDKTYYILCPNENTLLFTPYKMEIPKGYEMEIRPRSSTGVNTKLYMHNGTIDSDYRGKIGIIFINNSNEIYILSEGTSYAQGIIRETTRVNFVIENINETQRGEKGFGSTGM